MSEKAFEEWAILELMGHRRLAGLVREETIGSASFIRIDVPDGNGGFSATQFYNPASVYCMTPTTQGMAEQVAARERPQPVQQWELLPEPEHGEEQEIL
ncbi:MAG TPA: acetyltransferase [Spirochaetia bacterium]|nr:acetyltransferase [Spirochaetia bacterium]